MSYCKDTSKGTDDFTFAALILQERLDKLPNPNTPLALKLKQAINTLKTSGSASTYPRPDDDGAGFLHFQD